MNENENMELVETTEEPEVYEEERSGMSTGLAMLVGGLIAIGGVKAIKFAKRKYSEYKAAKDAYLDADDQAIDINPVESDNDE